LNAVSQDREEFHHSALWYNSAYQHTTIEPCELGDILPQLYRVEDAYGLTTFLIDSSY